MRRAVALGALVLAAGAAPAEAAPLAPLDLRTEANVQIVGAEQRDDAGRSVAPAGDVNGDGVDDLLVGAPGHDALGRTDAGAAYVVFGRATRRRFRRQAVDRGLRIVGPADRAWAGQSVAGAGDVNADGLDDVVVGSTVGAFVVFGRRTGGTVDLAAPGDAGVRIDGLPGMGLAVAGGRDVDGDGRADVVVSAATLDPSATPRVGGAFVLSGAHLAGHVDVRELGERGYVVRVPQMGELALVQDMTGDGRAEVVVHRESGVLAFGPEGLTSARPSDPGPVWVVFGRAERTAVDVSALGAGGFEIRDASNPVLLNNAVAGGGDVNGDGRGDVLVRNAATPPAGPTGGTVSVVLGSPSADRVVLDGRASSRVLPITGRGITGAGAIVGDVDGDGLGDVLVGAPDATVRRRNEAGAAFLVRGRRTPARIDLRRERQVVRRFDGAFNLDWTGYDVAPAGDFNGDGRHDLVISSFGGTTPYAHHGVAHVIYGTGRTR